MALEAFKEQQILAQLATKYEVYPNPITKWKREARQALPEVFGTVKADDNQQEKLVSSLYEKIG